MKTKCKNCLSSKVIIDSDPFDWFCDDDVAIVCTRVKTDGRTLAAVKKRKSPYSSDYSEFKVVVSGRRPYAIDGVEAPDWCPKKIKDEKPEKKKTKKTNE